MNKISDNRETITGWVSVYEFDGDVWFGQRASTKEHARNENRWVGADRLAVVPIKVTYRKGEGL